MQFLETLNPILQWLGVFVAGAIPYVESHLAAFIGVIIGVPVILAIIFGILGNFVSMLLLVIFGEKIRKWRKSDTKPLTKRQEKTKKTFDKYGVIGVAFLGPALIPSQLIAMAMVTFGVAKNKVILWQTLSIIVWGTTFGILAALGVDVIGMR